MIIRAGSEKGRVRKANTGSPGCGHRSWAEAGQEAVAVGQS